MPSSIALWQVNLGKGIFCLCVVNEVRHFTWICSFLIRACKPLRKNWVERPGRWPLSFSKSLKLGSVPGTALDNKGLCRHLPANALERHLGTLVLQELSRYRENPTSRKKRTVFKRKVTLVFYFSSIFLNFLLVSSFALSLVYQAYYIF